MSKLKYYYDSESLSYRKIERKKSEVFQYILIYLVGSTFLSVFFILLTSTYFESPKEKALTRELQNLILQYNTLNNKIEDAQVVLSNIEERDNSIYRIYFESSPISDDKRKAGFGGVNRYKKFDGYDYSELIKESNKRVDILQKRIIVQSKSLDEITKLALQKEKFLQAIPAIQPVNNDDLTRIASGTEEELTLLQKQRNSIMEWISQLLEAHRYMLQGMVLLKEQIVDHQAMENTSESTMVMDTLVFMRIYTNTM